MGLSCFFICRPLSLASSEVETLQGAMRTFTPCPGRTGWPVPQAVLTPLVWELCVGQGLSLYTFCLCRPCVSSRQALFWCLVDIVTYVIPGSESLFGVGTEARRSCDLAQGHLLMTAESRGSSLRVPCASLSTTTQRTTTILDRVACGAPRPQGCPASGHGPSGGPNLGIFVLSAWGPAEPRSLTLALTST